MHACMHTYIHTHIHTYTYTHTYVYIYIHTEYIFADGKTDSVTMTFLLTKAPTEPGRTLEAHFLSKHEEFAQKYGIGLIRVVNMGYRSVPWVPVFVGSVESLQLFFPAWGFRNGLKALFLFPARWGSLDLNKCNSSASLFRLFFLLLRL